MKKLLAILLCALCCAPAPGGAEDGFSLFPDGAEGSEFRETQPEGADPEDGFSLFPEEKAPPAEESEPENADESGVKTPEDGFSRFPEAGGAPSSEGDSSELPQSGADGGGFQAPFEIPAPSAGGTLMLSIGGEEIALAFDPDPEYSYLEDGLVQASFYAYGERDELYELYLIFPESVEAGALLPGAAGGEAALVLCETEIDGSGFFAVAAWADGAAEPEGSALSIRFDEADSDGSTRAFSGAFEATLVGLDEQSAAAGFAQAATGSFSFAMNFDSSAPDGEQRPEGLVTPPDAQKI